MARFAKDYGFSNVAIESFAEGNRRGSRRVGELWMTAPRSTKLYDIHDIALALASLNANGDVTGDLVDVGLGRAQDFEGKDVKGKFVLASARPRCRLRAGDPARGGRRDRGERDRPAADLRLSQSDRLDDGRRDSRIPSAWAVSPNTHRELQRVLDLGQTVTIRSMTKSEQVPTRSEIVHAEIPGDGSTTQEVAIGGHLYEGVIKQGANDDNSGLRADARDRPHLS